MTQSSQYKEMFERAYVTLSCTWNPCVYIFHVYKSTKEQQEPNTHLHYVTKVVTKKYNILHLNRKTTVKEVCLLLWHQDASHRKQVLMPSSQTHSRKLCYIEQ